MQIQNEQSFNSLILKIHCGKTVKLARLHPPVFSVSTKKFLVLIIFCMYSGVKRCYVGREIPERFNCSLHKTETVTADNGPLR